VVDVVPVGVVPPTARRRRTKTIMVDEGGSKSAAKTVRKSSRHKGLAANKPVMDKEQMRAAEKNLETGNFTALDSLSDDHLLAVAADSCVVFTPAAGTPVEAISLIRAKERVQAALAEVAARKELELAARKAREAALPVSVEGEGHPAAGIAGAPVAEAHSAGVAEGLRPAAVSSPGQGSGSGRGVRVSRPRRATLAARQGQTKKKSIK
jgi:hypothetical protein